MHEGGTRSPRLPAWPAERSGAAWRGGGAKRRGVLSVVGRWVMISSDSSTAGNRCVRLALDIMRIFAEAS